MMTPTFFATGADFRKWLENNHDKADELLVGFWKRDSGRPSLTWPESVDQALCFGWIDGVRRRIDDESYSIRFTPRRKSSIWSAINIAKVEQLIKNGLMMPAGLAAYNARKAERSAIYAYENDARELDPEFEKQFRKNKRAWKFFAAQPDWWRRQKAYWLSSAKQEATRVKRLEKLIEACENETRI